MSALFRHMQIPFQSYQLPAFSCRALAAKQVPEALFLRLLHALHLGSEYPPGPRLVLDFFNSIVNDLLAAVRPTFGVPGYLFKYYGAVCEAELQTRASCHAAGCTCVGGLVCMRRRQKVHIQAPRVGTVALVSSSETLCSARVKIVETQNGTWSDALVIEMKVRELKRGSLSFQRHGLDETVQKCPVDGKVRAVAWTCEIASVGSCCNARKGLADSTEPNHWHSAQLCRYSVSSAWRVQVRLLCQVILRGTDPFPCGVAQRGVK